LRASSSFGRFILYRHPQKYWEKRGGERYFREQESRPDRGATAAYLAARIAELNPRTVLEVGCGYGKNLKLLRERTDAVLSGIDFSQSQLEKAKNYLKDLPNIELQEGSGTRLPYADRSFDVVFTNNVILHNPPAEAEQIRKEILRVSKRYVVHKEDTNVNYSRYGYDHGKIYRDLGLRVIESHPMKEAVDAELTQFTIAEKRSA
jgi:ubiquinone/menaquinone biosynthesis C-methylase UbiE